MLIIKNIGQLATPMGAAAHAGAEQGQISLLEQAYIVVDDAGMIKEVGTGIAPEIAGAEEIDAKGSLVTPGLVDAHTHLVFGGWRAHELMLKLQGVPYLEILAAGGGILSTVRATRAASEDELVEKSADVLRQMLALGTTTCECKSGYGLEPETELRQLRAVKRLNGLQPVELVSTFLGAHALPPEYAGDREAYVKLLTEEIIPLVAKEQLAEYCDVFCETGVFDAAETEIILRAGQAHGLKAKIHADEIDAIGGSQLAGDLQAVSAEHLIAAPDEGIAKMAAGGTVACLLPATSFYLDKPFARARAMIEAGVPVAVATDFNPGSCPCLNLQLAMSLACYKYRMKPEEVLTAVTLNAAAAIGRADRIGTIEAGKQADILIWNAPTLEHIFYRFGNDQVGTVVKKGTVVKSGRRIMR